ncbi:MAG TPA: hypothetical protein VHJ18_09440 [Streptosporangiaceae bacterium]|jgi:hypothetical protein|nr:hypothetical protein [Streptosporangiaceae bacterium]
MLPGLSDSPRTAARSATSTSDQRTLGWSAFLLGEHVSLLSAGAAATVIAATAVGRNARVDNAGRDRVTPAEPPARAQTAQAAAP